MNYALGSHFLQVLGHLKEALHIIYRFDGQILLLKLNLMSLLGHLVVDCFRYLLFFCFHYFHFWRRSYLSGKGSKRDFIHEHLIL